MSGCQRFVGYFRPITSALFSWFVFWLAHTSSAPTLNVWKALDLESPSVAVPQSAHENLATVHQAMGIWYDADTAANELVVAQTHQFRNFASRSDDVQYIVAWESNGTHLTEKARVQMSCPDVEVAVPNRGPYVYEARPADNGMSLHPECGCVETAAIACPRGVQAMTDTDHWNLTSPIASHFVLLQNEWAEVIYNHQATLSQINTVVSATVRVVSVPLINSSGIDAILPKYACPGTRDHTEGSEKATLAQLRQLNLFLPDGHVTGHWCLVMRGLCSETAKVKVCQLSGAIGVIIVDHGYRQYDQAISVRFALAANERPSIPVLFVTRSEGDRLIATARAEQTTITVGPTVAGPPPPNFNRGSGIIVHVLGEHAPVDLPGTNRKEYPDLFGTVGWMEASAIRDLLFVCQPEEKVVNIYDISAPLLKLPLIGKFNIRCSRSGLHDYKVLDFRDDSGVFKTLLIDPYDQGNRLYYYNTQDPSRPQLEMELHANWEAAYDGLGQIRAGGLGGRYHIITWHCSDVFCGKNHGDALHILDTHNFTKPAFKLPLPMLSKGSIARDVGCDSKGICIISLSWDGLVALDAGVPSTVNLFQLVAGYLGQGPFSDDRIPRNLNTLRLHSGAQKVYPSRQHARKFYIEHAGLSIRQLQVGEVLQALQMTEIYMAELNNYRAQDHVDHIESMLVPPPANLGALELKQPRTQENQEDSNLRVMSLLLLIAVVLGCVMVGVMVTLIYLYRRALKKNCVQTVELQNARAILSSGSDGRQWANSVVGRPVDGGPENTGQSPASQVVAGEVMPGSTLNTRPAGKVLVEDLT